MAEPSAMTCPQCGGPLRPEAHAARAICGHCGAVSEIATEGALRVAKVLERHGIRMPERPRSITDVEDEIRERDAAAATQRQTAIVMVAVIVAVLGAIALVAAMVDR